MAFEITVVNHTPLTPVADTDAVALAFLREIGYLGREGETASRDGVPFRLLVDCFLRRPEKLWTVEELLATLATSRPTLYRHLNKLKALDLLEEDSTKDNGEQAKKTYRIRYGNLSKAWTFVEANVKVSMENYRRTIDHLHDLAVRETQYATTP
ncbi:MAG: helix-turn-helix domain-containing protein [Thermoplasmatota archaeon]